MIKLKLTVILLFIFISNIYGVNINDSEILKDQNGYVYDIGYNEDNYDPDIIISMIWRQYEPIVTFRPFSTYLVSRDITKFSCSIDISGNTVCPLEMKKCSTQKNMYRDSWISNRSSTPIHTLRSGTFHSESFKVIDLVADRTPDINLDYWVNHKPLISKIYIPSEAMIGLDSFSIPTSPHIFFRFWDVEVTNETPMVYDLYINNSFYHKISANGYRRNGKTYITKHVVSKSNKTSSEWAKILHAGYNDIKIIIRSNVQILNNMTATSIWKVEYKYIMHYTTYDQEIKVDGIRQATFNASSSTPSLDPLVRAKNYFYNNRTYTINKRDATAACPIDWNEPFVKNVSCVDNSFFDNCLNRLLNNFPHRMNCSKTIPPKCPIDGLDCITIPSEEEGGKFLYNVEDGVQFSDIKIDQNSLLEKTITNNGCSLNWVRSDEISDTNIFSACKPITEAKSPLKCSPGYTYSSLIDECFIPKENDNCLSDNVVKTIESQEVCTENKDLLKRICSVKGSFWSDISKECIMPVKCPSDFFPVNEDNGRITCTKKYYIPTVKSCVNPSSDDLIAADKNSDCLGVCGGYGCACTAISADNTQSGCIGTNLNYLVSEEIKDTRIDNNIVLSGTTGPFEYKAPVIKNSEAAKGNESDFSIYKITGKNNSLVFETPLGETSSISIPGCSFNGEIISINSDKYSGISSIVANPYLGSTVLSANIKSSNGSNVTGSIASTCEIFGVVYTKNFLSSAKPFKERILFSDSEGNYAGRLIFSKKESTFNIENGFHRRSIALELLRKSSIMKVFYSPSAGNKTFFMLWSSDNVIVSRILQMNGAKLVSFNTLRGSISGDQLSDAINLRYVSIPGKYRSIVVMNGNKLEASNILKRTRVPFGPKNKFCSPIDCVGGFCGIAECKTGKVVKNSSVSNKLCDKESCDINKPYRDECSVISKECPISDNIRITDSGCETLKCSKGQYNKEKNLCEILECPAGSIKIGNGKCKKQS